TDDAAELGRKEPLAGVAVGGIGVADIFSDIGLDGMNIEPNRTCHIVKDLVLPGERSLLQDIHEPDEKKYYEQNNFTKTGPPECPEIDRVRIEKDDFHVEEDEEDGHKEVFDCHRRTGIADPLDAAFEVLELFGGPPLGAQEMGDPEH